MYKYYKLPLIRMESFIYYSKKIGCNFLLCQGPGGNTSIKSGKYIYIKKSGMFLSDSDKNIFKKVELSSILDFYKARNNDEKFENTLSIETPFHVLLANKYVFHYHSLASIIMSSIYSRQELNNFLFKNKILPVDYIRPGNELAKEIIKKNNNKNFEKFFLYNHGIVVKGNNVKKVYSEINHLENLFKKYIDYEKLRKVTNTLLGLKVFNNKIENPNPKINYELFSGKYLFPDHSVFFPDSFKQLNKVDLNRDVTFDDKYIYLNKSLNSTEEIYFKTLLIIFNYINDKKVKNYIKPDIGIKLRESSDEQLRIKVNK